MHNWSIQPFCQDYDLASYTMLFALILYMSGETYSLTPTSNDKFFKKFFMAALFTLKVFVRNLRRGSRRRNFFIFLFDVWPGFRTRAVRVISQYTTYDTTATLNEQYIKKG